MVTKNPSIETTLQLKQTFAAPREKVFRAWTDSEELKKWFAPSDEYSTLITEVDLRVGGRYHLGMKPPHKDVIYIVGGTYREVRPPEKLVYTWSWEGAEIDIGETLVTVEFRDLGGLTEVVLTHEFFPTEKARQDHEKGWGGCLDRLEIALVQANVPDHVYD